MYIETRKSKKSIKYYLIHSFRDENNKVVKLRRYLGSNVSEKDLERLAKRAKEFINQQIEDMQTTIFNFSLNDKEIASLNKYNENIKIVHFSKEQWKRFTESFIYNTNAIEGSRVLENEVRGIINKKETRIPEEVETKGVAKAVQFIRTTKQDLSIELILKIHKLCFEGSKQFAGKLRTVEVVIKDRDGEIIHTGTPVNNLKYELQEFIDWYKKNRVKFKPLTLAAIIHNQFEDIHPFQDGNGRVGRLLLNFILQKYKYPPINILLEDRAEYYYTLQEYQKKDKLRPTMQFLIKQYKKTLKQMQNKRSSR